jgi:hypothetical protein
MSVTDEQRRQICEKLEVETKRYESGQPGSLRAFNRIIQVALEAGFEIDEIGRENVIDFLIRTRKYYSTDQRSKQWILLELGMRQDFSNRKEEPGDTVSRRRLIKRWHKELQTKDLSLLNKVEVQCRNWDFETCYERILKWNRDGRIA